MKTNNKIVIVTMLAGVLPFSANAGNHYSPGVEGLNGAVLPPPGLYYRAYAVNYHANQYDKLPDSQIDVNAFVNRLVWVTGEKVLGGDLAFEAIVPVISTDISLASGAAEDSAWGVGDIFGGGVLGWHGQRWDAVFGAGVWSPTGKHSDLADPGLGYSEVMLTFGGNVYLTESKDISVSALARYELPDQSNVDDGFLVEWGLNKKLNDRINVGLVGYDQWQIDGVAQKHAVGAEAGYFWPESGVGLNLAAYHEYSVEHDFKGNEVRAYLTKVF